MDRTQLLDLYSDMWLIRAFEQGLEREFQQGNVPGMLHTGLGQEAVQAALAANLRSTDAFFPDHRCHGINALAQERHKGEGERIMAELFGRATGVCSGKGGSLHSADPEVGNFGDNAVEGSYMATVLGVAFAAKMRGRDDVACAIIGDGTAGRGEFHESLNMAAIWDLPVLYAMVNNGYAISNPVASAHATPDMIDRAKGYRIECAQVDGNDIEAAHEAVRVAIEHIRSGKGPYFLEFKTWRWQGIFSGDLRPAEEIRYWREDHDPILMAAERLAELGVTTEELEKVETRRREEIDGWIAFSKESPTPDLAKATADVYASPVMPRPGAADTSPGAPAGDSPAEDQAKTRKFTFVKALNSALDIAMERHPEMFLIGEDIGVMGGDFGVTRKLYDKYGADRVRDTPLSEAAIIGTCVGSAMMGMRPVAEIMFADFLGECYDQIVNNAAKVHYMFDGQFSAPLVIRTACGGGFGGGPHHSQMVEGWFLNVPGIVIVAPSNPADAKGLLLAAIESNDPVLFLEHKALYRSRGEVPDGYYTVPIGKAAVARQGSDITVVASMRMVPMALTAAERLAAEGVSVEVIDLRTIKPYDAETIVASVAKTGRAVVASEAPRTGGLGAELSAMIHENCFSDLQAPVGRVDGLDTPIPFSVPLEHEILPDDNDIEAQIRKTLGMSPVPVGAGSSRPEGEN